MTPLSQVVLSLGSNVPARHEMLMAGLVWLREHGLEGMRCSTLYTTPALHPGKPEYMNAVVAGSIALHRDALNAALKRYEATCGRNDDMRCRGLVPIDIDIVMWNGAVLRNQDFQQQFFQIGWTQINNSHDATH